MNRRQLFVLAATVVAVVACIIGALVAARSADSFSRMYIPFITLTIMAGTAGTYFINHLETKPEPVPEGKGH